MSMADFAAAKAAFEGVSKGAYLDVLVPGTGDFDAAAIIREGVTEELARAPSRRNLYFDENAKLVVILRTPSDTETVYEVLPHLRLTLTAHISDSAPQGNASAGPGKQDLVTSNVPALGTADIIPLGDQTYTVWQPSLQLTRPRVRLQKPAVYFSAALSFDTTKITSTVHHPPAIDYLKPFEPLPRNVLDALNDAPEYRGKDIVIPEDRLTRIVPRPVVSKDERVRAIRGATKRAFPTSVALYSRVKYTTLSNETVVAALHLEASNVLRGTLVVDAIAVDLECMEDEEIQKIILEDSAARGVEQVLSVRNVKVRCLTEAPLPIRMGAGDVTVLLYGVTREAFDKSEGRLDISISAMVLLESSGLNIELQRTWQSDVEVRPPPAEKAYRWTPAPSAQDGGRPSRTSSLPTQQRTTASGDAGVTFTFAAPEVVGQDETFHLCLQCWNRSDRSRRFVINTCQHRRLLDAGRAGVFCKTPAKKLGLVGVGSKADAALEMKAIGRGAVDLGTVTITDVDSGEKVEVADLPDVVAVAHSG